MTCGPRLHTDTPMARGMLSLLRKMEQSVALTRTVNVYLAGGMAVHLYTGSRLSSDVDAEFDARLLVPSGLHVMVDLDDGQRQLLYINTNYNPSFALRHEDHQRDAIPVNADAGQFKLHVLVPVDLALSKVARFAPNDQEDIAALAELGLLSAEALEERADAALSGYIGNMPMVRLNLRDALEIIRRHSPDSSESLRVERSGEAGFRPGRG